MGKGRLNEAAYLYQDRRTCTLDPEAANKEYGMGTWPNFKKAASSSPPRYKAIVTQMRQRLLPHDNLSVWGLAQVMVEEGLIPKDPTSVIWELRQRKLAWGEPYTVIEIYELEESDGYW